MDPASYPGLTFDNLNPVGMLTQNMHKYKPTQQPYHNIGMDSYIGGDTNNQQRAI